MRKNIPKRKDNTANSRMQQHIQRVKEGGGKQFTMLLDAKTNQSLQFLIKNTDKTQRYVLSSLIQEAASKAGFKFKESLK